MAKQATQETTKPDATSEKATRKSLDELASKGGDRPDILPKLPFTTNQEDRTSLWTYILEALENTPHEYTGRNPDTGEDAPMFALNTRVHSVRAPADYAGHAGPLPEVGDSRAISFAGYKDSTLGTEIAKWCKKHGNKATGKFFKIWTRNYPHKIKSRGMTRAYQIEALSGPPQHVAPTTTPTQ